MNIILLSFHVKDIGVEGLSRASLHSEDRACELQNLKGTVGANEAFYLSTCNRTEYLLAFDGDVPPHLLERFEHPPRIFGDLDSIVRHLLEVALSKDSVVFGESQILGQFKRAYEQCLSEGLCGHQLGPLLNAVIREAKAIRTRVGLTQCHTSISTVAGHQLYKSFKALQIPRPIRLLFVGAGETNLILARYLKKRTDLKITWTSRTLERATHAVRELGGEVLNWTDFLEHQLPASDVICVATHSRDILVDARTLKNTGAKIVCDLAVPANARASDCESLGVEYLGIDRLQTELSLSGELSTQLMMTLDAEVTEACRRIESEVNIRSSKALITGALSASESVLEEELLKLAPEHRSEVEAWARKLVKKINHAQLENLKNYVSENRHAGERPSSIPNSKRHLGA